MKYVVTTSATVQRTYWVDANDEKAAEEMTCDMSPGVEDDVFEETISIIPDGEK